MAQTSTPLLKLEKPTPGTGAAADVALLNRNMDKLDGAGVTFCTSTTRPAAGVVSGTQIYETDTKRWYWYDGVKWNLDTGKYDKFKGSVANSGNIPASGVTTYPNTIGTFTIPRGYSGALVVHNYGYVLGGTGRECSLWNIFNGTTQPSITMDAPGNQEQFAFSSTIQYLDQASDGNMEVFARGSATATGLVGVQSWRMFAELV